VPEELLSFYPSNSQLFLIHGPINNTGFIENLSQTVHYISIIISTYKHTYL